MKHLSHHRIELPAQPTSPGAARRFVANHLDGRGATDVADVAVLLTSEIVTNAVVHAAGPIGVEVVDGHGSVRVAVSDGDPELPVRRELEDEPTSGRGLNLVEALAHRWGTSILPDDGKSVWFELDLRGD